MDMTIDTFNQAILDSLPSHVAVLDRNGTIIATNQAWEQFARANDVNPLACVGVGVNYLSAIHPTNEENEKSVTAMAAKKGIEAVLASEQALFILDYPCHSPEERRWFQMRVTPLHTDRGGAVVTHENITERRRTEKALKLSNRAIESSNNPIIITDYRQPDNPIIYVNPAFETTTGYSAHEVKGLNPRFLHGNDHNQPNLEFIRTAIQERHEEHTVIRNYRKDGTPYWSELFIAPVLDDIGHATHFVGIQYDITEIINHQEILRYQATHDALTELPNRHLLAMHMEQMTLAAKHNNLQIAIVFLDLDHFKLINDTHGHSLGDRILRIVAQRLQICLQTPDTVFRYGGDEFILVIQYRNLSDIESLATRIGQTIEQPMNIADLSFRLTCSTGISLYPEHGQDLETLLKNADTAMFQAKDRGRNELRFFSREMDIRNSERLTMQTDLRRALDQGELFLHYQPQVMLSTGTLIGLEALVRWQHPEKGLISPGHFIPLAEETGLIVPIGDYVLRTACAQNKAWQEAGLAKTGVAVNLSARQLRDIDLVETVTRALTETGLEPHYLELELTESLLLENVENTIEALTELRALGVKFSIDDFGTGYSSLSYLETLPVDRLKIDLMFVRYLGTPGGTGTIAQAITSLGHALNLKVIAEGIETKTQLDYLHRIHCDEGQGYYFSKPLPDSEITPLLSPDATPLGLITRD